MPMSAFENKIKKLKTLEVINHCAVPDLQQKPDSESSTKWKTELFAAFVAFCRLAWTFSDSEIRETITVTPPQLSRYRKPGLAVTRFLPGSSTSCGWSVLNSHSQIADRTPRAYLTHIPRADAPNFLVPLLAWMHGRTGNKMK
jgi:hypothetical protein